jgi:hypothetical protein
VIERCEKCGKPFMDKSEVNRHKMYEHIVPISPFEENKEGATIYKSVNAQKNEIRNKNNQPGELQKSIMTTTSSTSSNVDTTNKGENNNDNNYNSKVVNARNRPKGFRSFRL